MNRKAAPEHAQAMADMYRNGFTLQEIADLYGGITRERVRQIIRKLGITGKDGGVHVNSVRRKAEKRAQSKLKQDHRRLRYFGCTQDEFERYNGSPTIGDQTHAKYFRSQSKSAQANGYEWKLTFPQWCEVWGKSGKWGRRGLGFDLYCMARKDRHKPFEVGNVEIITLGERSARNDWWHLPTDRGHQMSKHPWADVQIGEPVFYRSHLSKQSLYESARQYGKKHPNEDGTPKKFKFSEEPKYGVTFVNAVPKTLWRVERTQ